VTSREVRDAVHGLITLTEQEWRVIDSAAFQRLRNVQQLAMTHLVYPGARHSRFEHCIGACHVAGRMVQRLAEADPMLMPCDRVVKVRAAALVHDIGHGPFSHVSEFVFERLAPGAHLHEKISAAILRHDAQVRGALGGELAHWVGDLLAGEGHGSRRTVERDIVAGPADIDKLDYLLRDSHFCGVNYGRYDLDKVVEAARLVNRADGVYLAYHPDGVFALEEMLLARYHMHRQVYGHKTRIATDLMLERAMLLGVAEGLLPEQVFRPVEMDEAFVQEYLRWDDRRVIDTLVADESSPAGTVMRALRDRRLFKRAAVLTQEDLSGLVDRMAAGYAMQPDAAVLDGAQRAAEAAIADAIGVDPLWVALQWQDIQNPLSSRDDARITDKEILITDQDGTRVADKFSELSEVFRGEAIRSRRAVAVYVGCDGASEVDVRGAFDTVRRVAAEQVAEIGQAGQVI
jgi:HD superfamily phosphohydrolase